MNVALFDMYSGGHHLPYAYRIKQAVEATTEHEVSFVTLTETEQSRELFGGGDVSYLDPPESPPLEEREESFADIAERVVEAFFSDHSCEYDVVHFLYSDTILGQLWRHCPRDRDLRVVAELNGTFFHRGVVLQRPYLHEAFLLALRSPVGHLIDAVVPDRTAHEALWKDLHAFRCLNDRVFDTVVVHSEEAENYLTGIAPGGTGPIETIPYPAPSNFGRDIAHSEARARLDLPADASVLLFFGSMRGEKGITFLLEALRGYRGPEFTAFLAGPPDTIDLQDIEAVSRESHATVVHELGYIDTPELYYRAADAVVLPYRRRYGKERPSQLFQEVCSAGRPVIVSNYGTLGRLTKEWDLGVTFEQNSHRDLRRTFEVFATEGIDFSPTRMQEFTRRHSYSRAATLLSASYANEIHKEDEAQRHGPVPNDA